MGFSSVYAGSSHRVLAGKCAMKHTVNAVFVKQLGRIKPVFLLVFSEEELCDSHALNQMHEPMAARALP
jgi:hypothetical protein